jgi:tRNA dimethylallyltransferase
MNSNAASDVAELRIICGPTAAGKSALALELAARHGATIISADSRQIYRRFDIGTAKPTRDEQARVPHRGIDIAEPTERGPAARWAVDADRWVNEVSPSDALIVGGTGFYLRALTTPLFDAPPLDAEARAALARELAPLSLDALRERCAALDPSIAHLGRAQLLRAIEVATLTGQRLSDLQRDNARAPRLRARWLVVDPGERLAAQLERRIDRMLDGGWIDETRALMRDISDDAPAWQGCGYGAVRDIVTGVRTPAQAREAILIDTRQYAKRQRTWFRHQLRDADVTRVDPHDAATAARIEEWWHRGQRT